MKELVPVKIVEELDKYIVGQGRAKKSVAIAIRNRWRRQHVDEEIRDEIMPNNIILIGPTGVGKTEIARRLAKLESAPFIKVEASKFTEVGYVGRDVESMIRDLVDIAVSMVRNEQQYEVEKIAEKLTEERLVDLLLPPLGKEDDDDSDDQNEKRERNRDKIRKKLKEGKLENRIVDVEMPSESFPIMQVFSPMGMEEMGMNIQDMLGPLVPKKTKKKKMTVEEARQNLIQDEIQKLIDMDAVINEAIDRVENTGMVFIDEIDKIAGEGAKSGPDVSREGVQRDILPVVEGTSVVTKYGVVTTEHILFIASGAFHVSKPSDLIPELQGRFPIRVELNSLTEEDFFRILTEPKNALLKQYTELLKTEGISLKFQKGAIREIARLASEVNDRTENIGARRLHTIVTTLLEDYMFDAPDIDIKKIVISAGMVKEKLKDIVENDDLSRYIL